VNVQQRANLLVAIERHVKDSGGTKTKTPTASESLERIFELVQNMKIEWSSDRPSVDEPTPIEDAPMEVASMERVAIRLWDGPRSNCDYAYHRLFGRILNKEKWAALNKDEAGNTVRTSGLVVVRFDARNLVASIELSVDSVESAQEWLSEFVGGKYRLKKILAFVRNGLDPNIKAGDKFLPINV
jgi:hypothetical protein